MVPLLLDIISRSNVLKQIRSSNGGVEAAIEDCDGYLVPGGFGERGWLGKILAAKYCREKKIPYFGICLGMQVMAVEFARHVAKIEMPTPQRSIPILKIRSYPF